MIGLLPGLYFFTIAMTTGKIIYNVDFEGSKMSNSKHSTPRCKIEVDAHGFCSFCMKPSSEVGILIRGGGFPVCSNCIKKCYELLIERYPEDFDLPDNGWITK